MQFSRNRIQFVGCKAVKSGAGESKNQEAELLVAEDEKRTVILKMDARPAPESEPRWNENERTLYINSV